MFFNKANKETVVKLRKAELLLENALKSIGKETESIERNTKKATKNYLKDKKEYESLEDSEKEKWLKERGYKKEDFDKDVYGETNETIDKNEETRYSLKRSLIGKTFPYYGRGDIRSEANERATRWAHQKDAKVGDIAFISYDDAWYEIEVFDDLDSKYQIVKGYTEKQFNTMLERIKEYESKNYSYAGSVNEGIIYYEDEGRKQGSNISQVNERQTDLHVSKMVEREYARTNDRTERERDSTSSIVDSKRTTRYSIKLNDNVETEVTKTYGKTYNWSETGYILNDGTRLDLSGKNQGASGGRRTIDHRDIFDSYEDIDGTNAMIAFMARGNIRVSPEYPGINIQVEPNAEQYRLIQDLVERLGWKQKYFSVDFDNKYGEVVETLNYEGNVSGRKVVSDIKYYFKEGKLPYQSELSKFRYSVKINADMTDSERYEILKDKKIENIPVAKELTKDQLDNIQSITSFEDLNKYFGAEKRSIIKKIASEFGVFKEYYNKDIELEFEFSKGNYNESYQKQKQDFVSYAKMFSVFDDVVEKAVGVEVHNKNLEGYKVDPTLKNVYVLASAFIDNQNIVPVKLEIKEFNDKNNKLYVAIALDKIKKTEVLEDRDDLNKEVAHSSLSVNISIRDLLKNVNPNDNDFYKYIPKKFFEVVRTHNIRESRKASEGEIKKKLADISKKKVYSKKEAQEIVK